MSAAGTAQQAVGCRLRTGAAAHAADGHLRSFDRQGGIRRAAAGTRDLEGSREQRCVHSRQRTDLQHDALDRLGAALFRDRSDLQNQRLANGQLVHRADATARRRPAYVRNRTDRAAATLL